MTIALATLAGILAVSYPIVFWLVLRHLQARDASERDERARDARERDTAAVRHMAQVEQLVNARTREIADLLQRIQAPQMAVLQHQADGAEPGDVYPLSDVESAEARQEFMTAEEIEEQQLAIERMEKLEREGLGVLS